jgi:hypothetical protein
MKTGNVEGIAHRYAIYLDQPHVLSESGIMKFIYRLYIKYEIDYTLIIRPLNYYNSEWERHIINFAKANYDKTKKSSK